VNTQAVSVCFCSPFSDRIKAAPENSRTADILPFIEKILIFFENIARVDAKSPLSGDILFQISMNAAINRSL
jgi:hypothetical protein